MKILQIYKSKSEGWMEGVFIFTDKQVSTKFNWGGTFVNIFIKTPAKQYGKINF